MREVRFRFWDSKEKRMYEMTPELAIGYNGEVSRLLYHEDEHNAERDCVEWEGTAYSEHIIPLQYTGLKDKNGKEIYEGDILLLNKGTKRTVFSVPGGFAIECLDCDFGKYGKQAITPIEGLSDEQNAGFIESCTAVIGNIYENPELLEEE